MRNLDKYKGVIPAFYACYDEKGEISPAGFRDWPNISLTRVLRVYM